MKARFQRNESEAQAGGWVWASVRGTGLRRGPLHPCFRSPNPSPDAQRFRSREGLRRAARGPVCSADFWSLYRLENKEKSSSPPVWQRTPAPFSAGVGNSQLKNFLLLSTLPSKKPNSK